MTSRKVGCWLVAPAWVSGQVDVPAGWRRIRGDWGRDWRVTPALVDERQRGRPMLAWSTVPGGDIPAATMDHVRRARALCLAWLSEDRGRVDEYNRVAAMATGKPWPLPGRRHTVAVIAGPHRTVSVRLSSVGPDVTKHPLCLAVGPGVASGRTRDVLRQLASAWLEAGSAANATAVRQWKVYPTGGR